MGMSKQAGFPYEYLIVAALCLINFGPVSFCLSCAGIFYTPVAADIGTSPATLSYFLAAFSISMILVLTPLGKLFVLAPGSWPLICVAAVAYGMIYGEQTVFCPIVTRQFYGMRCYGELYSSVSTIICIGVIASSFIGGTIVNVTGSYLAMFAFIGTALAVACLLLFVAARLRVNDR